MQEIADHTEELQQQPQQQHSEEQPRQKEASHDADESAGRCKTNVLEACMLSFFTREVQESTHEHAMQDTATKQAHKSPFSVFCFVVCLNCVVYLSLFDYGSQFPILFPCVRLPFCCVCVINLLFFS